MVVMARINMLKALIIRDLMARFGRRHLGFVWTILEPMILTAGVMVIRTLMSEPVVHGIPITTFVMTGYMPLTLWRHMTNPMTRLLRNNAELLYHRPVEYRFIMLSRGILEFLSTSAALAVIYFIVVTLGVVEPIQDPGLLLAAWIMIGWYFGAMGIVIGCWTELWEPAEKFIQPGQYLALPLSGMFFMVDWLPRSAQKLLLLNPTINCFEMFRAGFFGASLTTHFDVAYVVIWSIGLSAMAVLALYHVRDKIEVN